MISLNICILLYLLVLLIIFKPNTMNCSSMTVIRMTYRSECMGKLQLLLAQDQVSVHSLSPRSLIRKC